MKLVEKGQRNLRIASIIETEDFLKLSSLSMEYLCSIIINRLYYGVFLIGKSKLLEKDPSLNERDFLGHSTKCDRQSMWGQLLSYGLSVSVCNNVKKLRDLRNEYDYQSDKDREIALKDLDIAKKMAKKIEERLKEFQ